jgi:hypothetical protein
MKLKLKEKELPLVQLRLVVPAVLGQMLDQYVAFVRDQAGREVEAREIAVEMLAQFMAADRQFKRWRRRDQKLAPQKRMRGSETGLEVNGQACDRVAVGNDEVRDGQESEMGRVGHRAR